MQRSLIFSMSLALSLGLALALSLGLAGVAQADEAVTEQAFGESLLPLLRTYCFSCHDVGDEIPLAQDESLVDFQSHRQTWVRALAQVRLGSMPPADADPLDAVTRSRLIDLIDNTANAVDCVRNPNAGKVALRRLNRAEYRNTIRDLTGVDYKPAEGFPGDDVGYGFDNIGDVLSLPPLLIEKYLDAAEFITGKAIYTPPPPEIYEIEKAASSLIGAKKYGNGGSRLTLASQGTVSLQQELPFGGTYNVTITASGDQAGDEPVKMQLTSGRVKKIIEVKAKQPQDYAVRLRLGKGTRKIDFSFINDYYVKDKADRNLHLHHVRLSGMQRSNHGLSPDRLPASHHKILFKKPDNNITPEQAAQAVLSRFASRAFRRPATNSEVKRLVTLATRVQTEGGSFEESIQVALQAILISPHFLFKVEEPGQVDPNGKMPAINDYELATRLSYFLWSSMPDDELLMMAHRGQIRDRQRLREKIGRMLQDPRSNRFVDNFAGQWLQLRNLEQANPDPRIFRGFDDDIRRLMRRETLTFFAAVMRGNLPVTQLLDGRFTFLNERLAQFYGIEGVTGDEFRRVSLQGTPRGGLLTQASVLTVTSNPTRTSPVKRGKWILENLLNTPPPPAPPDIPELEKSRLVGTLRERMEQHRENPACATCHNMMDPLGFALEQFDAVGRFRSHDGQAPVDASGKLPDGTEFNGVEDLRTILATEKQEQFVRCFTEKLLIYATGRGTEYYDRCAIDEIVALAAKHDYEFAYIIAGIVECDPFQKQGYRE
ncbi:MAG: DUF1592 domain-containing protein [Rubripirellula sp.]|nr:DUF1592 domain-containing protein [Rubripirellula sp.]